jgi:hypothetical protein
MCVCVLKLSGVSDAAVFLGLETTVVGEVRCRNHTICCTPPQEGRKANTMRRQRRNFGGNALCAPSSCFHVPPPCVFPCFSTTFFFDADHHSSPLSTLVVLFVFLFVSHDVATHCAALLARSVSSHSSFFFATDRTATSLQQCLPARL